MKERPILFSAPMVRALLEGSKLQTRRVAKLPENAKHVQYWSPPSGRSTPGWADPGVNYWTPDPSGETDSNHIDRCPYGQVGDQLWVREAYRLTDIFDADSPTRVAERCLDAGYSKPWAPLQFEADGVQRNWMNVGTTTYPTASPQPGKLRPGIHMPRWCNRIELEVTGVRVERLQAISERDALAEGVETWRAGWDEKTAATMFLNGTRARVATGDGPVATRLYMLLWEALNGAGSWNLNPWVWVIEFRRVRP